MFIVCNHSINLCIIVFLQVFITDIKHNLDFFHMSLVQIYLIYKICLFLCFLFQDLFFMLILDKMLKYSYVYHHKDYELLLAERKVILEKLYLLHNKVFCLTSSRGEGVRYNSKEILPPFSE